MFKDVNLDKLQTEQQLIGEGNYSKVYKLIHNKKTYAVKQLRRRDSSD